MTDHIIAVNRDHTYKDENLARFLGSFFFRLTETNYFRFEMPMWETWVACFESHFAPFLMKPYLLNTMVITATPSVAR